MALRKPTTARSIAAETLCDVELRREFAGEILRASNALLKTLNSFE
jgi:hypothetical protein